MFKFRLHLAMLWALVLPQLVAAVTFSVNGDEPQLLKNATIDELQAAIQLVEDALEESAKRNVARLEHIRHNKYVSPEPINYFPSLVLVLKSFAYTDTALLQTLVLVDALQTRPAKTECRIFFKSHLNWQPPLRL